MSSPEQSLRDVAEFFEKTISDQIHLTAIDPEKVAELREWATERCVPAD